MGILQARVVEWVAMPSSRDRTQVSCIAGRFFTIWVTREARIQKMWQTFLKINVQIIFAFALFKIHADLQCLDSKQLEKKIWVNIFFLSYFWLCLII